MTNNINTTSLQDIATRVKKATDASLERLLSRLLDGERVPDSEVAGIIAASGTSADDLGLLLEEADARRKDLADHAESARLLSLINDSLGPQYHAAVEASKAEEQSIRFRHSQAIIDGWRAQLAQDCELKEIADRLTGMQKEIADTDDRRKFLYHSNRVKTLRDMRAWKAMQVGQDEAKRDAARHDRADRANDVSETDRHAALNPLAGDTSDVNYTGIGRG